MSTALARLRRAGPRVGSALVGCSLLVLLFVGLGPRTGQYRTVNVLSGSMGAAAPTGALVVVTPLPPSEVKVGDVITYQIPVDDHRVVTHRVVEVVEAGDRPVVRTKGDANEAADPWLARLEGDTAWKARLAVPGLGTVIRALRAPWLSGVLVRGVPVVLALVWLAEIWVPGRRPRRPTILVGPA